MASLQADPEPALAPEPLRPLHRTPAAPPPELCTRAEPPNQALCPRIPLCTVCPLHCAPAAVPQPLPATVERVHEFQGLGVMRVATLEDGSLWCLTSSDHIQNIEVGEWVCSCAGTAVPAGAVCSVGAHCVCMCACSVCVCVCVCVCAHARSPVCACVDLHMCVSKCVCANAACTYFVPCPHMEMGLSRCLPLPPASSHRLRFAALAWRCMAGTSCTAWARVTLHGVLRDGMGGQSVVMGPIPRWVQSAPRSRLKPLPSAHSQKTI